MVIRSNFVWLSHNIKPELCPIIILQNATGQFMGTHVKKPLYVGEFVDSYACVRSKKGIVTLTPQRDGSIGYFGPSAHEDLSPIANVSTTNSSIEVLRKVVAQFEEKGVRQQSDSGEGDNSESEQEDKSEDEEESADGSDNSDKCGNSDNDSEEDFEPGSDDEDEDEESEESESTELFLEDLSVSRSSVNTDGQKLFKPTKAVHLKIEEIPFTDSSQNKDVDNSKTTVDLSPTGDVTVMDPNTDIDILSIGGNFITRNPERSATGIDFPQYNGDRDMGLGINILSKKIENEGKKELSEADITQDMN